MTTNADFSPPDSNAAASTDAASPDAAPASPLSMCSVGIGVLDEQHRFIFELARQARKLSGRMHDPHALNSLLSVIIRHTHQHFVAEETMMQAFGYPELIAHQVEHGRMTVVLVEFEEQLAAGGHEDIAPTFLDYLESWILLHVSECDSLFTDFFRERGAQP
jgi:hemerythrin